MTEPAPPTGARASLFVALALVLLALGGLLLVAGPAVSPAHGAEPAACQPVTDVGLDVAPGAVYTGTAVVFTATVLTGSLPVTYTWAFGDASPAVTDASDTPVFTVSHSYTATGVFSVTLSTWNTCTVPPLTTTVRVTVTPRPCLPPAGLSLTYTPTQVYAHQQVLFAGEIATASLPLTYTWDFGDWTTPLTGTSTALLLTATHTFSTAQDYTVTLSARSLCAITPTRKAVTLTVAPCGPISGTRITYGPTGARPGEAISFSVEVTGGSPPWVYEWAFGDGQTGQGEVVTHTYSALTSVLSYTVVLTAANPCSQRSTSVVVGLQLPLRHVLVPIVGRAVSPAQGEAHLGYGANVACAGNASYLADMGFDWAKGFATWDRGGPPYSWGDVDNQLREFLLHAPNVLVRVSGRTSETAPPVSAADRAAFRSYVQALAKHVSDTWRTHGLKAVAYEIWNEPNLDYEWGGSPNAAQYTALLKEAYQGVKAGDPRAIVVSAGLATTGGSLTSSPAELAEALAQAREFYDAVEVVWDLTFLRQMYANGARGYFDALGSHPYGGRDAPDKAPKQASGPIYFRRAEEQHQVMVQNGDPAPVWATEFGWVLNTDCGLGEHNWMKVSEAQQASYLAGAYAYADEHWPWMGPMFLFDLDFGTVSWYDRCDPMRWYSILYRENPADGGAPILFRQAFSALRDMSKESAW
jgi:PKD repeat protein